MIIEDVTTRLLVRYSFAVVFLRSGTASWYPADIRFHKVSGLNAKMQTEQIQEGGENSFAIHLPTKITYDNLILERGRMLGSIGFAMTISEMFSSFSFAPVDIIIIAINPLGAALSAWQLREAYPISWSVSDLDANANEVIIDTLELAYRELKTITI